MSNKPCYFWTGILGIIAGLAAVCAVGQAGDESTRKFVAIFWYVIPPTWFFAEYYWHRIGKAMTPDNLEYKRLKDSQDLQWKVWFGFALAIAVLILK